MTTDRRLEQLVADALRGAAPAAPPDDLVRDVVFRAGRTRRRPRWLALLTEGPMVRPPVVLVGSPKWRAASIALAVVLVAIAGTLALVGGGWLQRRDATVVLPKATLGATPEVTRGPVPTATAAEVPGALMVYTVARRLQPGEGRCTEPPLARPAQRSSDGSRRRTAREPTGSSSMTPLCGSRSVGRGTAARSLRRTSTPAVSGGSTRRGISSAGTTWARARWRGFC